MEVFDKIESVDQSATKITIILADSVALIGVTLAKVYFRTFSAKNIVSELLLLASESNCAYAFKFKQLNIEFK
jgi:hypothetical protein